MVKYPFFLHTFAEEFRWTAIMRDYNFNLEEYLATSVETIVKGALRSKLFHVLQDEGFLTQEHDGGCVLFSRYSDIKELMDFHHI